MANVELQNRFKINTRVPLVMTLPLIFLAVGALFAGKLGYEFLAGIYESLLGKHLLVLKENRTIEAAAGVPTWVVLLPTIMFIVGTSLAFYCYQLKPDLPKSFPQIFLAFINFCLINGILMSCTTASSIGVSVWTCSMEKR